jgi:hypothetical protein
MSWPAKAFTKISIALSPPQSTALSSPRGRNPRLGIPITSARERAHGVSIESEKASDANAGQEARLCSLIDPRSADLEIPGDVVRVPQPIGGRRLAIRIRLALTHEDVGGRVFVGGSIWMIHGLHLDMVVAAATGSVAWPTDVDLSERLRPRPLGVAAPHAETSLDTCSTADLHAHAGKVDGNAYLEYHTTFRAITGGTDDFVGEGPYRLLSAP